MTSRSKLNFLLVGSIGASIVTAAAGSSPVCIGFISQVCTSLGDISSDLLKGLIGGMSGFLINVASGESHPYLQKFINRFKQADLSFGGQTQKIFQETIFQIISAELSDRNSQFESKNLQKTINSADFFADFLQIPTVEEINSIADEDFLEIFAEKKLFIRRDDWLALLDAYFSDKNVVVPADYSKAFARRLEKEFFGRLNSTVENKFVQDDVFRNQLSFRFFRQIFASTGEIKSLLVEGLRNTLEFRQEFRQFAEFQNKTSEFLLENFSTILAFIEAGGKSALPPAKFLGNSPKLNEYFTGRGDVLQKIREQLGKIGKASLYGLHGLGKTQTILRYAELYQADYAHIIYINAAGDVFLNSMAKFQEVFELHWQNYAVNGIEIGEDEKKCYAVKDFLSNDAVWSNQNRRFLLIFDNVDEINQVRNFVPEHQQGDILYTSNSLSIEDLAKRVEIEKLDETNAQLLLFRRGKQKMYAEFDEIPVEKHEVLSEIARELAFFPVLLENAGATIAAIPLKFEKYLEKLRISPTVALDREHSGINYQYKTAKNGFSISFNLMCEPDSASETDKIIAETVKQTLFACSMIASADIPEELLQRYIEKLDNHLSKVAGNEELWEKVRTKLTKFDLLEYDVEKETYDMHRFVQFVIWNYFAANEKNNCLEKLLTAINELFPYSQHETKKECEIYLSHSVALMKVAEDCNFTSEITAKIYNKIGIHLREIIKFQESIAYFQKAINFYRNIPEKKNDLAYSLNALAIVYEFQGKYNEAIAKYLESLQISEETIGKEHPDYAIRLNDLAITYRIQGRYDEAIKIYLETLEIGKKTIGKQHPDYATALSNLGIIYQLQTKYDEAGKKFLEALPILKNAIGKEHPGYATCLNNLAVVYQSQGKYDEAVKIYLETLEIGEKTIGKKHSNYALRLSNLANVYQSQGKYDEAIEKYLEALQIDEHTIGKEHCNYAIHLSNLASVYKKQEKINDALALFQQALDIFKKTWPENHPHIKQIKETIERCEKKLRGEKVVDTEN